MSVTLQPIDSSNIEAAGYDPDSRAFHIRFKSGPATYVHQGTDEIGHIAPALWEAFLAAPSKGAFYHRHIKGQFPHTRQES